MFFERCLERLLQIAFPAQRYHDEWFQEASVDLSGRNEHLEGLVRIQIAVQERSSGLHRSRRYGERGEKRGEKWRERREMEPGQFQFEKA